jgi:hypothetical protein
MLTEGGIAEPAVPRRAADRDAERQTATPIAVVGGGGLGTLPAMEVLVFGGHGKVGLRLLPLLARDGHRGRSVIWEAEQASAQAGGRLRRRRDVDGSGQRRPSPPGQSVPHERSGHETGQHARGPFLA